MNAVILTLICLFGIGLMYMSKTSKTTLDLLANTIWLVGFSSVVYVFYASLVLISVHT